MIPTFYIRFLCHTADCGFYELDGVVTVGVLALAGSALGLSPDEALAAGAEDSVAADFSAVLVLLSVLLLLLVEVEGAEPLPLKSVTYQPPPFSWKPAAVTILLKVGFLHSGQSVKRGSLIL